jgi:hypothetical protein
VNLPQRRGRKRKNGAPWVRSGVEVWLRSRGRDYPHEGLQLISASTGFRPAITSDAILRP